MYYYLFVLFLFIHGLIHAMGFVNQLHWATIRQATIKTLWPVSEEVSKVLGVLWILTCLGFMLAAVTYGLHRDRWMVVTLISLIGSQTLIIFYWQEARYGTLVNIIIAVVLSLTYAQHRFNEQANREVGELLAQQGTDHHMITSEDLKRLPLPVQQWLIASGVVGRERVHTVRLRQQGYMRTTPDGSWMPTQAVQYFGIDTPGFVWRADVSMASVIPLAGRDKYADGKGNMLIKLLAIVPVVDAADAKTDQGTLLRYLGEMCWFPSAALSPYITWKAIDASKAQATLSYKGVTASAIFTFDDQHRLVSLTADRYMGAGNDSKLTRWYIPSYEWKTVHGITIPVKGDVIWRLPAGDFNYYRWEITDIDYNVPELYD